jgi:hypothetical protein
MAADPKAAPLPLPHTILRGNSFRAVYANTFRVRTGNDVSITFGYQTDAPGVFAPGTIAQSLITDEAEIIMTPLTLKVLHRSLGDNSEIMERALGQAIEIPAQLAELLDEAKRLALGATPLPVGGTSSSKGDTSSKK